MKVNTLEVKYKVKTGIEKTTDIFLRDALRKQGWDFVGSGTNLTTNIRDLSFTKKV